jgi:DNA-binding SARP family transcriptional activator
MTDVDRANATALPPSEPPTTPDDPGAPIRERPSFPIQRSKAQRPPLRPDTLHRARLLDWLSVNVHHRLVLLVAKAGYGKTTLLADFARRTRLRTIWFRVDDDDRDWISVLHYLVAAGREVDPTFASATVERLAEIGTTGGTRDEIIRTFVGELARLGDEPTVLVIDDYHVLDESPDARGVIADVLARAPERFTLVLATRRRPALAIARLRALGEVAELTTDDLRFTENETEALFRDTYHQPLEADVLSDLARRTEGWAASLQLVRAAVRERSATQVRAFVRSLSGVDENLYDYLAEEVVGDLEPAMQDFLMRTSILQVVDPVLAEVVAGVPQPDARRLIEQAERIGLLSRRGESARHTVRYHPLVRDFLEDRLVRDIGDEAVRELHRTVARFGESSDWRLAAHHYSAVRDWADVGRVMRSSLATLVGRGEIQIAHTYLEAATFEQHDAVRYIVESRLAYEGSRLEEAKAKARAAYESVADEAGLARDVALLNLTSIQLEVGPFPDGLAHAQLLRRTASDATLASIANAAALMADRTGADLLDVKSQLESLVVQQQGAKLAHFAGITLTNLAFTLRQMGAPERAQAVAVEAIRTFPPDTESPAIAAATCTIAWSLAAQGDRAASHAEFEKALAATHALTRLESHIEAAEAEVWYGSETRAAELLAQASADPIAALRQDPLNIASAELAIRTGAFAIAERLLGDSGVEAAFWTVGHDSRLAYASALLAARRGRPASEVISSALRRTKDRHASLYSAPLRVIHSIITHAGIDAAIVLAREVPGSLSMASDVIVPALDLVGTEPLELIKSEARTYPLRWLPALRVEIGRRSRAADLAVEILAEIGELEDVPRLRTYGRSSHRTASGPHAARRLARRLAPQIVVCDLGRVMLRIGDLEIPGTGVRRKCLSLLCFLLTRPQWSATKEQVLDGLWPETDPEVAGNSLNQTLYFLRRVFDEKYKEGVSAEYIHYSQDIVWLDSELIESWSRDAVAALDRATEGQSPADILDAAHRYRSQFALDFMYEEWAIEFRDRLHVRFVEAVERSLLEDASTGHFDRAIELARTALDVAPDADELEALLVRLYRLAGSHAAAAEQYEHYARTVRSVLGVDVPPIDEVASQVRVGKVAY